MSMYLVLWKKIFTGARSPSYALISLLCKVRTLHSSTERCKYWKSVDVCFRKMTDLEEIQEGARSISIFNEDDKLQLGCTATVPELDVEPTAVNAPSLDCFQILKLLDDVLECRSGSTLTIEGKVRQFCSAYADLTPDTKDLFLKTFAQQYYVNHESVRVLSQNLIDAQLKGESYILKAEERLKAELNPQYGWIFTQIARLEDGVKFLVDLREDSLNMISILKADDPYLPHLRALNSHLRELLALWFSVGFFQLQRVTWDSSCDMLQKISEYEAVHPMRNWTDLKARVGPYRRCFVFTHASMPKEPIVVLHVALTNEIPASIKKIVVQQKLRGYSIDTQNITAHSVQREDPNFISTAIFYSVTSTQRGLQGIELGNYLIKQVVKKLQSEFPKIYQFSSLSPVPGFLNWLMGQFREAERGETHLFTDCELEALNSHLQTMTSVSLISQLRKLLSMNRWIQDETLVELLETPLMRLCVKYLYLEKRRGYALDSVAAFHLRNGAVMWRLNWKADLSPRGMGNSCGMMVNYRYFLEDCEDNSRRYLEMKHIEASDQIKYLARVAKDVSESYSPKL